ncbi:MAG: preprotein translocase subunit SecG [Thermodesulfobacteriota bacterium]
MTTLLIILHILVCLFLIGIVLLQQGKGADMGATFGGGSNQTVFGADGPMPILSKVTTASAVIFMITSLTLAYISANDSSSSVMKQISVPNENESGIEKAIQPVPDVTQKAEEPAPVSQEASGH